MTASPLSPRSLRRNLPWNWLGVAAFLIFAFLFLLLPTMNIITGALVNGDGNFTFDNLLNLFKPEILNAFALSVRRSFASASSAAGSALRLPWPYPWAGCLRHCAPSG